MFLCKPLRNLLVQKSKYAMEITLICKIKCNLLYKRYKESLNRYFCLIVFEFLHALEGFVGLIKDQLYLKDISRYI